MGQRRRAALPNERLAAASRAAAIASFAEDVAHRSKAAEVLGLILRHPVLVTRTARYVAALPQLSITLSRSPIGDDIAGKLQHSKLGLPTGRLAQSVIDVPPKVETYLSGRPRQALRTNLGHARRLGLTVERAPADADFHATIDQVLRKREATDAEISRFHAEHPLYAGSWAYVVAMAIVAEMATGLMFPTEDADAETVANEMGEPGGSVGAVLAGLCDEVNT